MTTENTALTVQARAALALESSTAETYLTELAVKSKAITAITNKDGRTECHAAAMTANMSARSNSQPVGLFGYGKYTNAGRCNSIAATIAGTSS